MKDLQYFLDDEEKCYKERKNALQKRFKMNKQIVLYTYIIQNMKH